MKTFTTILSEKQLTVALIDLDRSADLLLSQLGNTRAFHENYTNLANEVMESVAPAECARAADAIEKILLKHGVDPSSNLGNASAAA